MTLILSGIERCGTTDWKLFSEKAVDATWEKFLMWLKARQHTTEALGETLIEWGTRMKTLHSHLYEDRVIPDVVEALGDDAGFELDEKVCNYILTGEQ